MKSQRTEYYPPALRLGYVFVNLDMKVYTVHYGEGLIVRLDPHNFTGNVIGCPVRLSAGKFGRIFAFLQVPTIFL